MSYFPLFVDLSQKRILVVGAGNVASRKIEKLLPFNVRIDVIAPKVSAEVEEWAGSSKIVLKRRVFEMSDLADKDLIIVAVDDLSLQKVIFDECTSRRLLCNSVDSPDYCNFIFPALIKRGDFVIGLTSGGRAPGLTAVLRKELDQLLPEDLDKILERVRAFRASQDRTQTTFLERADRVKAKAEELLRGVWKNSKD